MKKKKETKVLNDRQIKLYHYLAKQTNWKSMEEIVEESGLYGKLDFNSNYGYKNSNQRRTLTKDIRALKDNDTIFTVILSTSKGIKIATKDEWESYFEREEIKLKRAWKLHQKQKAKANKHYQTKIDFENGSSENYVRAFKE